MYDYIKGILTYTEHDHVVVEAGGIGYRIFCANPNNIPVSEDRQIMLYLHLHVREDLHILYGFPTREERKMFRLLLEVSGIGPKGALSILSQGAPQQVALAIAQEDVKALTRFPGIGQKTAQRLILDLKDKLKAEGFSRVQDLFQANRTTGNLAGSKTKSMLEALEALLVLGFSEGEVYPCLQEIVQAEPELSADQLIKRVLRSLGRA